MVKVYLVKWDMIQRKEMCVKKSHYKQDTRKDMDIAELFTRLS